MIEKLNKINFIWEVKYEDRYQDWFTPFYENLQKFIVRNKRYPNHNSKENEEKKLAMVVNKIRQAKKGKGGTKLTEEMIAKLDDMGFIWEVRKKKKVVEQGLSA